MCEKGYEGPGPLGTDFEVRDLYGFVLAFFRGLRDNLSCCKRTPGNICLNSACKCSQAAWFTVSGRCRFGNFYFRGDCQTAAFCAEKNQMSG